MKRLVVIGGGGFGREVIQWAQGSAACGRDWEVGGFLDDREEAGERLGSEGLQRLGGIWDYEPGKEDLFICAIGQTGLKRRVYEHFRKLGGVFTRVVHESCLVGSRVELGAGVILCPGVKLTCDIRVGENTAINLNTAAGHDVELGAHGQISSFCDLTGGVKVGHDVLLGSRVSLLPGVTVGDGATVGAGSVVLRPVPGGATVFGNPAKRVI